MGIFTNWLNWKAYLNKRIAWELKIKNAVENIMQKEQQLELEFQISAWIKSVDNGVDDDGRNHTEGQTIYIFEFFHWIIRYD